MASTADNKNNHFTRLILGSLALGLLTGLFVGDYAAPLKIVGDAYVGLLQMTVLPYILFSLIANIGRLNRNQAGLLARTGIATLLALWLLTGLIVIAMSLALPQIHSGSFFSSSLITPSPRVDMLQLFIPANLFQSLSSNAVPAVVVFCLLFGVALMGFDNKRTLLEQLDLVTAVLQKVNDMVVRLTPLGIFAITSSAAGTLTLTEFGRLQAYLLTMTVAVALLVLWVYPLLLCACTSLRWRQVVLASRDALITAFVLGSVFAVIPILIRSVEKLVDELGEDEQNHQLPQLMLPLAYPFPDAGKILTLLFLPFAAWFYGDPFSAQDMVQLLTVGPVVMFGKVATAVPYLLGLFEVPADIFQLFLASGVLMGRLADMVGAMHLITFTALTTVVISGRARLSWRRLLRGLALLAAVTAVLVVGMKYLLYESYKGEYGKSNYVLEMRALPTTVAIEVLQEAKPNPVPLAEGMTHGQRIVRRGVLRVGFNPDNLPFSFINGAGQLVGFDIDLMQELAADLNVALEFVPYDIANLASALQADHFDLAVSGITATVERSREVMFSDPYLYVNMAFVVQDHRRGEFENEVAIREFDGLRLGVRSGSYFAARVRMHFPGAEIVPLDSERDFFDTPGLDALITTAEGGSAWTLLYPGYATINPVESTERAALAFVIPEEMDMEEYLELWIELRQLDGTHDRLFDYWILGRDSTAKHRRWSIMRDVLQWVD